MWRRLKALIVKELLTVLRDPRSRFVLVGPPLLQLFVFSFAATQDVTNVSIAVFDEDRSAWSVELVSRFEGSPTFSHVLRVGSLAEARALLDRQKVLLAVHVGQDFARDIALAKPAKVQIILDGRRSNAAQIVLGYANDIVAGLAAETGRGPAAATVERSWFNQNLQSRWFTIPSIIAVLLTISALLLTGLSVARERELGTFEQLLVSPITPTGILIGKTVPPFLIGSVQAVVFTFLAVFVLRVPFTGSIQLYALAAIVFLVAMIGIGLFISALSRTQQQAILGAFVFIAPAVLLSGFATPVENMPVWLQWAAEADPLKHMMIITKGLFLKDMPVGDVLANTWPMVVIAAATMPVAAWMFRRKLG